MTMRFIRADIRPGGSAFYVMTGHGMTMYATMRFLDIRQPDCIVYDFEFSDEQGNLAHHPKLPAWPESIRTTILLAAESPGQTRVTITGEPCAKATPAELEVFTTMKAGMSQGWTSSFDNLEAHLASLQTAGSAV